MRVPGRVSEMARARDALVEARRTEDYDLAPPTDDRPFFFYRGRPFLAGLIESPGRLFEEGQYLIATVLLVSTLLGGLTILLPLWRRGRHALRSEPKTAAVVAPYFAGIGVGFMLAEMAIMQRFVLYLGHPTPALTAVVAGLLLGAGLGSLLSSRIAGRAAAPVEMAGFAILLLIASNLAQPRLFAATQQLAFPAKVALTELLVVPLGAALGTLMPLGIGRLLGPSPALVPWAWGINGFASVVGACAGALSAVAFGFSATLHAGAACYGMAGLAALWVGRRSRILQARPRVTAAGGHEDAGLPDGSAAEPR